MYKILGSDQKEYGPVTPDQLRQWIIERRLHAQSLVRLDGSANWLPLAQFPEFSATLAGAGPVAPGVAPLTTRTNPMAITGLVMGILALPGFFCCYGFPFNILGIVFSFIALGQIKKNPATEQGKGLAIAGMILSFLSLAMALIAVLFLGFALGLGSIMQGFNK